MAMNHSNNIAKVVCIGHVTPPSGRVARKVFCVANIDRDESILCFFLTYYAFKQFPKFLRLMLKNLPIMLKKIPFMLPFYNSFF